jgi:hypothetical protein
VEDAALPREKRLTLDEIERLPREEFDALPASERRRYFDYMNRENFPSPWEFYGYEAESDSHIEFDDDESATEVTPSEHTPSAGRMETIARRGSYCFIRFEKADGRTGYLLEEDGRTVSSDDDGYEFFERVGMISGSWELFLAVNARGELWADRVPIPGTEPACK